MNKPVDFRNDVCGHIILWAKGWYNTPDKRSFARLNEVLRVVTGMPDDYIPHTKSLLGMLAEIATKLGIKHEHIVDSTLRSANRLTSYHVSSRDAISFEDIMYAYIENIASVQVTRGDERLMLLPDLEESIRSQYNLQKYPFNEINKV